MVKLHSIDTELFKLDGGAMFGVVPKRIWQKKYPADENNLCVWAMRCMLIEDEGRIILIDTGLGTKQSEKFFSHYDIHGQHNLKNSIKKAGFEPSDITDVLLTHLHFDHVGGAIDKVDGILKPAFPNAKYWSNKTHWDAATLSPNAREKASFLVENILPIQESGQLSFLKEEQNIAFSKNVKVQFFYGHTNAMMVPIIKYNDRQVAYVADLFPSIGHLPIAYVAGYDSQPLVSMQEKKIFLEDALLNKMVLFFEHEPFTECCTLEMTDKGINANNIFALKDLLFTQ